MSEIELVPASESLHRSIAKKAAENLGKMADGNGMKADQIRLSREDTQIYRIPGSVAARLTTETTKTKRQGKAPQGTEVASPNEAMAAAEGQMKEMLKNSDVERQITEGLKKDPGQGYGMTQFFIPLPSLRKDFSVTAVCPTCAGNAVVACGRCGGAGNISCLTCSGSGFSNCQWCHGMGRMQNQQGAFVPCTYCGSAGRIPCVTCRGNRSLTCTTCQGRGKTGCADCRHTGFFTEIYQVNYKAECIFEADWRDVPREGNEVAHKLGLREMATEKHAEIIWQPPEVRDNALYIPCIAFLPASRAEFTAPEGRNYPALVAGLQGRILTIDPVLDPYVKPGISALMKLSKGPMARQALIDTACKYRLIRQTLAGLARSSKKTVYQKLIKNYPLLLSDKYARATVKYAASAVTALSARPRYKGLALGTALAALPAAIYYISPLRHVLLAQMAASNITHYIVALDIIVWLIGWGGAVYTIKLMTAAALNKMLPENVQINKNGLPSSGMQGLAAALTTGLISIAVAIAATEKPEWVLHILKLAGH